MKPRVVWSGYSKAFNSPFSQSEDTEKKRLFRAVLVDDYTLVFEEESGKDALGNERWCKSSYIPMQFLINAAKMMDEKNKNV